MRGEHTALSDEEKTAAGSSPRARGALRITVNCKDCERIIPACAGSTASWPRKSPGIWDHPRVRGEHIEATLEALKLEGSSPRARGAPDQDQHGVMPRGIIPACAGSTYHAN